MGPKQAICVVRCASQKIIFAMRCVFIAVLALVAENHCDVGQDANITASAMPRCGELSQEMPSPLRNSMTSIAMILAVTQVLHALSFVWRIILTQKHAMLHKSTPTLQTNNCGGLFTLCVIVLGNKARMSHHHLGITHSWVTRRILGGGGNSSLPK